jgi:hypothetical protein
MAVVTEAQADAQVPAGALPTVAAEGRGAARPHNRTVAALFVAPVGPYSRAENVELWDEKRDARLYAGPYPVVAHPPCERWGRYWFGGPSSRVRLAKGDDGGCFAAALAAVRRWGGVLEHPAASAAWEAFGLHAPSRAGGWINADFEGGWTCCVDQEFYGHRAQKATWLYACRVPLPSLRWGKGTSRIRVEDGYHSKEERRRKIRTGICQRLSHRERAETPVLFRDLLLAMARGAEAGAAASAVNSALGPPFLTSAFSEL